MRGEPFRGSFFKGGVQVPAHGARSAPEQRSSVKVERVTKRRTAKAEEDKTMREARKRDRRCRFPGCECGKFKLVTEVAHLQHRGSGGNPKGDRTKREKLILLCIARHRLNAVSLDRGTVRVRPLTKEGTDGPCAFDISTHALGGEYKIGRPQWFELATETQRGILMPFTQAQANIVQILKGQL